MQHRRPLLKGLLASPLIALAAPGAAWALPAWRGLDVPRYPNANDYHVTPGADEYDIYFSSQDSAQAVFEFYRGYLEQRGFRVTNSTATPRGFKAEMVRGQGGPGNTVRLDENFTNGLHKVEIEFHE